MTIKETSELMDMVREHAKTGAKEIAPGYSVTVYRRLNNLHISFSTGEYAANKAVARRAKRHARNIGLCAVGSVGDVYITLHSRKDFNRVEDLMIFISGKSMQKTARNNAAVLI